MAVLDANDLKAIKDLMEVTVEEVIEKKGVVTKDYIGNLPTKDELYTKMDEVMRELKAIREEVAIQTHQVADHDDRLEKIESHVGISSN
jgi:chromosome segregation ATPase